MQKAHATYAYTALHNSKSIHYMQFKLMTHLAKPTHERLKTMNMMLTYQKWRNYTKTRDALNRLGDRDLIDLGIKRSDIDTVARKSF